MEGEGMEGKRMEKMKCRGGQEQKGNLGKGSDKFLVWSF